MNGDLVRAVESDVNGAMQAVVRLWWQRAGLVLLQAVLTVVQFGLLIFIAVLCARASPLNDNLWGVVIGGGVYSAISLLRLRLDLGLPGLPEETPGERVLFGVQTLAFGGLAFTLSNHELARWGWTPMVCSAVLHIVLKGGYWTIYSPAHQRIASVKSRLLLGGAVFAAVFAWISFRWFDELETVWRLVGSMIGAYVAASGVLGMRALTRVLREGLRILPGPATAADYAEVEAVMAERARLGATGAAPLMFTNEIDTKNAVSSVTRFLFALVLFPLSFVVGIPLPWLYAYVLLRRTPALPVSAPSPAPRAFDDAPIPWPSLAALAAGQVLIAGTLAGGAIFGSILLASYQAAWLGMPKLCVFLAVSFGGIAAVIGVLWGALLTAELVNERLRFVAVQASGQLVSATAERVGWAQRGLSFNEVEQVISSSVGGVVQLGHSRGAVVGVGARVLDWVVRRFVAKTRDAVFAVARRNGRNDVTVWDIELALREGVFKTIADRIAGYLRAGRSLVQLGYATLFVPCVISVAVTGAVAEGVARAEANACDSTCFYNARCHLLRSGRGSLPCCAPIPSVSGEEHAATCTSALEAGAAVE